MECLICHTRFEPAPVCGVLMNAVFLRWLASSTIASVFLFSIWLAYAAQTAPLASNLVAASPAASSVRR